MTPLAEQDIESALDYITVQLCNGQAAVDLLDKIENAIGNICEFPYSSADCKYFLINDEHIRREYYNIFYDKFEEDAKIKFIAACEEIYKDLKLYEAEVRRVHEFLRNDVFECKNNLEYILNDFKKTVL